MYLIEQILFFPDYDGLLYTVNPYHLDRVYESHGAGLDKRLRVTLGDLDDTEISVKGLQCCE